MKGMKSLRRKVRNIDRNLGDAVEEAVAEGGAMAASQARANVAQHNAVWTGNLMRNIYMTGGVSVGNRTRFVLAVDVPYAAYVEFGTGPRGDPTAPLQFQFRSPSLTPSLVSDIVAWVMTKPVFYGPRTRGVAWGIAEKIAKRGTHAQPFLRPAWFNAKPMIIQRAGYAARTVVRRA